MTAPTGFVGFDPDEVDRLVRLLGGAGDDVRRLAARAQAAVDRVAPVASTTDAQSEVDFLRRIGLEVTSMRDEVGRRLMTFRADEAHQAAAAWGQRSLSGVSEAVEDTLKRAERWVPGRWVGGEWMPGHWRTVLRRELRVVGGRLEVDRVVVEGVKVPGRARPRTWVDEAAVPDEALRKTGRWLGRSMNAVDVGLAGWKEWGDRKDLSGAERALHAGFAGVTVGIPSAAGGAYGYAAGAALTTVLIGAAPVAVPAAAAVVLIGGIAGAMVGSEIGQTAGKFGKELVKDVGRGAVGVGKAAAKKVFGLFS